MNNAKLEHELNNVRLLVSSSKLSLIEKGELYFEFCTRYNLEYKTLTKLITGKELKEKDDKEYKHLHRCVSIYKRYQNASPKEQVQIKKLNDRNKWIALRLQEPNKSKKIDFLIRNMHGLNTADIEALVAIMNGTRAYTEYEDKINKEYKRKKALILKLKKEMLGLEG